MKILLLCLVGFLHAAALGAERVTLYSYQHKPPYVLDGNTAQGLYFDLAEQLNARLPQYTFEVRQIPRKRLDRLIALGKLDGLVLGANTAWFPTAMGVLWTDAFIEDANLLVSRAAGPDSRLTLESLSGKQLGLVAGHHYPELHQIPPGSEIHVQEGGSEKVNLELLQRDRIDATIIGASTLDFYRHHEPGLADRIYVLDAPLYRYKRQVMVPLNYEFLVPKLNRAISDLRQDPAWENKVRSYR